jgi:hypothetical protein
MPNWYDVTRNPEYQSLPEVDRLDLKKTFFNETIGKDPEFAALDDTTKQATWMEFMQSPDDTGEGALTSAASSFARGALRPLSDIPIAVGALTGSEGIEKFGRGIQEGVESRFPVNPIQEGFFTTEIPGVAGQVASMLAGGGAGAVGVKALGGTAKAAQLGAKTAVGTQAFAGGTAGGASSADVLGLKGGERIARSLLGGVTELASEAIPFGMGAETGLVRNLLGESVESGAGRILTSGATEAAEEGFAETAGQATDIAFRPEQASMDLSQIGKAMLLGGAGGVLMGGINNIGRQTPLESQTPVQQSLAAKINAIPTDTVPDQTDDEKLVNMNAGGTTVVDPQGKTAVIAPPAPEPPSQIIAENLATAAENTSNDASKAVAAARAVTQQVTTTNEPITQEALPPEPEIRQDMQESRQLPLVPEQPLAQEPQAPVELPVPTVAPTVETPSPAMEQPKKSSQTITDSNGEIAPAMSVPPPTAEAGAGVGEAPLVTEDEQALAAQRRADLLSTAADAAKGKTKAKVSTVVTSMVTPKQPVTPQGISPKRVRIAGEEYSVIGVNPDGTLKLSNDQGDEFDTNPNEQWSEVAESPKDRLDFTADEIRSMSKAEFIRKEIERAVFKKKLAIQEAEVAIRNKFKPKKPLPVGVSKVTALQTKARLTPEEKQLLADYNSAQRMRGASDVAEMSRVKGEVWEKLQKKPTSPITPTQETPTPATEGTVMPGGSAMERDATKGITFRYEMRARPPSIGTHPENGFVSHEEGGTRHGFLTYDRPLTEQEIYDYELKPVATDSTKPTPVSSAKPTESGGKAESIGSEQNQQDKGLTSSDKPDNSADRPVAPKKGDLVTVALGGREYPKTRILNVTNTPEGVRYQVDVFGSKFVPESSIVSIEKPVIKDATKIAATPQLVRQLGDIAVKNKQPLDQGYIDSIGGNIPQGYVKQGDLYVFQPEPSPQTTTVATPTETAAPLAKEAAVASVVQQPAEGSIPAVEQESATTAIESNEKADIGYGAKLNSARNVIRGLGPDSIMAQQQALNSLLSMSVSELQSAFEVLTGDTTKLANKRQLANNILNEILGQERRGESSSVSQIFKESEKEAAVQEVVDESTDLNPITDEMVESSLTPVEKREAAIILGKKTWADSKALFKQRMADWMAGANETSKKLIKFFKTVANKARLLLAASIGLSMANSTSDVNLATSDQFRAFKIPVSSILNSKPARPQFGSLPDMSIGIPEQKIPLGLSNVELNKRPKIDTRGKKISSDAAKTAQWVLDTADSEGYPFIVTDKIGATMYFFDEKGVLLKKSPVLVGKNVGDFIGNTDAGRITPSGRFEIAPETDATYGNVFSVMGTDMVDSETGELVEVAIHRLALHDPSEKRPQRIATTTPLDNRISWGCMNLDNKVMDWAFNNYPLGGLIYILPETAKGRSVFAPLNAANIESSKQLAKNSNVDLRDDLNRKEDKKLEAAQKKREELNLKTLNSLIQKTRTNVVQGTVNPTDANQAVAILNSSGEIPNVLFTWIGTSKDFLADPANRVRYPETWAAVSANSKIEGMSENGQPIVFTDNVGVSDLDRKLANLQGTTPEVAAVRRVILHENIHKGMFFLSMKEKMQIFSFLRRMYSPQELDSLAESYSEYSDWRTNQVSYFSILEEAMTRDFDSMVEIPRDGILAEFMQFLRGIWQKITGKTSEPTLKDYKDVFRLIRNSLKNSEKANADMLVNGGKTKYETYDTSVRPYASEGYGSQRMEGVSTGDNSPRAQAIRKAVSESNWNELSPTQRAKAMEDFGLEAISSRYSFDATLLPVRITNKRTNEGRPASLFIAGANPSIEVRFDTRGLVQLQNSDATTAFAFIYDVAQEEIIHTAQHLNTYKLWQDNGSVGEFEDFEVKQYTEMLSEMYQAAADGLKNGDVKAANVIVTAWNIYNPQSPTNDIQVILQSLAQSKNAPAFAMEVGRQLLQFKRQDFTTETGWMRFVEAMKALLTDITNALKTALTMAKNGQVGKRLQDEISEVNELMNELESASQPMASKVEYDSPNDAAFNSGAEVARNTDYDERDKEVRSTIRAAYDIAPKTNGPSVPLDELFSIVKQSMPDVTETEFSRILQGLYEDSGALLIEGESPFATFTTEGERAGSAIIMPPTDMTKDNVISMLRGMSAANPAPSGGINQELYDTVLTRLRDFISNGGRIPLPIQLDRSGEANMDNYTGKKAGLGGGLRQGSGVGRAGQTDSGTPLFDGLPEGVQGVIPQAQRVESEVSRNREAIAGRGENREGKAGARPDMGMASGGYTFADYAQIASRIGARVQEVSNDIGGGLAVMADENGATTILINAAQLSERMAGISFGLDEDGAIETIGNALVEELIHAADLAVQREAWLASGRRKPFTEFAIDSDKSMLDEMREVVASSNDPVKATQILHDAIQASRQLYGAGATPSDIDELFSSPKGNISSVMSEFVRQMIQQDMHQTVSEASLFRRFIERVMKMLQKIRDAIAPAKAGEFGDILKNRINETEMMLAMAYQQTGARASMIDSDSPATNEYKQNIDAANTGKAKAPFGGVQFKNFMPIDRTVKSAEEYSDAAIKYVNNLENEGVSIDNIANSVISPAFLESIGIEQDLMAQDALTIEVRQRVDNAARKAKSPDRKKQLSKLSERLSAFWQGVGSKKGQHLGQRRYLVNKARYSWMFIREIAEKVMKEARTNILISNFGSENATSFTQNSYANSDKANQQAVDEIAQDVVNNDEWALIKEGEQVFEGADKTLWERAKALVRRFAFYARAEAAEKVSASKASMTDAERNELNAILTMPKAEREKAKAKDLAEFRSIMGKLLGEESPTDTPTEKKKRKKRKEIIDTVEKRVAEGQPIEPTAEEIANEIEIAENKASQIVYRFEELYRQGFKNPPEGMSKKEQKDSIIRAFRDQVKNPVSFEQFAERLDALKVGEEVSERLFLTASRERADLARMKKFKIEKRRVEIADKQASRLIYSTEERLRQGSKDLSKSTSGDSINKAFKDQVSDPVDKSKFAERLAKLNVSPDVAERLFKTAEREKTDLEAMAAFNILQGPKALQRMINEINNMRRGEEIPLRTPIPWRQLLSQSAKTVEEYRQRIFDAISANEELKNATPEQKARLADLFAEAWESNRTRILDGMLERMIRAEEAKKNLSKEGAKALQAQRMRIVEDINLGIFDNDELAKRMAEKFGIKSEFTETEREKINSLIEVLQDEGLNAVKRQVAAYKLLEVLQGELKIPVAKMLADFWVSSVLSGPNTIVSIGLAVASGAFELSTALSRVFIAGFTNPKQLPSELAGAYKTLARLLSAYGRQARIAWQYLVSGDPVFLDPSMNDVTENMQWGNIGKSNKLAEQMAKSDKILVKSAGLFMRTVSRLLTALDVFNSGLTKEGSLSIVFRQIGLDPEKIAALEKKSDLKPYKDAIIQQDFKNTPPKSARDKAILDAYALADMMKELDKLGNVSENANFFGQQGAMTLDPSGLGGVGYRAIRSLVTNAEAGADRFLKQAQRGWNDSAQNGDRILSGLELAFAYFMQFLAYNAANFGGVRFARFAGNKFNQGLSFIPGIGFARAFEAEFDPNRISGKEAFIDSIRRNQLVGVMLSVAGYQILKSIADEPDDEKRGWFINGGWGNLTPEKKQQKLAAGEKEYTIGINGKVFNYANWPISSALAAIGSLSDLIRFSPDQWNDKNVAQIMASAAMSGAAAAADIPALSQFQELFGNSLSSKDPNEKRMERFAKVMSSYAGGFVPRFLKDIDYAQDPNLRKYETLWEKTASHIPVYRRYEGKEYYDILGQQIQRNVYPGSREFMVKPTDPAYKVLGALNSRGIWLTPANAEHRMVGKGARRRSLTQEEADNYSLETGKGYKQMLLRYGQRALQMPTERARAFLLDKADEVRDRALKKVYRGYQPAT